MSILVVGAIHHDVIVETPSIPREDETLPGTSVRYAFGGKGGNQAVAAARLGTPGSVSVTMAACIGHDAPGDDALKALKDGGVNTSLVQRVEMPTGMSVALSLPDGGYGAVIVSASNLQLDTSKVVLPRDLQWLVLQNELPERLNLEIARHVKQAGAKVLLNAAPARAMSADLLAMVDLLVINRVEAADMLGVIETKFNAKTATQALAERYACNIVVTLGGEGLWVSDGEHTPTYRQAHAVHVVSTHGAGDAFIGALVVQLWQGTSLNKAAHFANAAAALHVSTPVDARAKISLNAINALAQTSNL